MNKQFSGYETVASGFTNNMYLPRVPLEEWSLDELRRALCAKANGDVLACEECENRCRYGRRIVELLKPVEMEKEEKSTILHAINARHEKSENAYLQAIASGNPEQWFIDHGRDVRNGMVRMKKRFPGMTADEAQARLAAKGIAVECAKAEPLKVTAANTRHSVEPEPVKPAPVANNKLKIAAVDGEYFNYRRTEDGVCLARKEGGIVMVLTNVNAICAEIRAAFEMMGGRSEAE